MDDLISRQAAIEAVKIPEDGCLNMWERQGIIFARVEARRAIQDIPSAPAVPLDKLCEWLAWKGYQAPDCTPFEPLCNSKCEKCWEKSLTNWMEGLDV